MLQSSIIICDYDSYLSRDLAADFRSEGWNVENVSTPSALLAAHNSKRDYYSYVILGLDSPECADELAFEGVISEIGSITHVFGLHRQPDTVLFDWHRLANFTLLSRVMARDDLADLIMSRIDELTETSYQPYIPPSLLSTINRGCYIQQLFRGES